MSWLRKRAEDLQERLGDYDRKGQIEEIEKLARDYAERGLRASYKVHTFGITMDEAIPLALAAADKDDE